MSGTRENRTTPEGGLHRPIRFSEGVERQQHDPAYYDKMVAELRSYLLAESEASELNRVAFGNQAVVRYDLLRPIVGHSVIGVTPQVIVSYTVPPGMVFHWTAVSLQFNPPDFHTDKVLRWRLTVNNGQIPGLGDVPPGVSGHDNFFGQDINLWNEHKALDGLFVPGEATCGIDVTVSDQFEHFCVAVGIISGRVYMPISMSGVG